MRGRSKGMARSERRTQRCPLIMVTVAWRQKQTLRGTRKKNWPRTSLGPRRTTCWSYLSPDELSVLAQHIWTSGYDIIRAGHRGTDELEWPLVFFFWFFSLGGNMFRGSFEDVESQKTQKSKNAVKENITESFKFWSQPKKTLVIKIIIIIKRLISLKKRPQMLRNHRWPTVDRRSSVAVMLLKQKRSSVR